MLPQTQPLTSTHTNISLVRTHNFFLHCSTVFPLLLHCPVLHPPEGQRCPISGYLGPRWKGNFLLPLVFIIHSSFGNSLYCPTFSIPSSISYFYQNLCNLPPIPDIISILVTKNWLPPSHCSLTTSLPSTFMPYSVLPPMPGKEYPSGFPHSLIIVLQFLLSHCAKLNK